MLRLEILRRRNGAERPWLQCFDYTPEDPGETVATALARLNAREDLRDANGAPAEPIRWDCACLQKKCGACAMVLNGTPGLACDARLSRYRKRLRIAPLGKFPVVADLEVDRGALYAALKELGLWLAGEAEMGQAAADLGYEASRCLQCGCCLEVCPNYLPGGTFAGMAAAAPAARLLAEQPPERRAALAALYRRRVYEGCGKSLACRNVCPAGIDVERLLVNSNAMAVWKRLLKGAKE